MNRREATEEENDALDQLFDFAIEHRAEEVRQTLDEIEEGEGMGECASFSESRLVTCHFFL